MAKGTGALRGKAHFSTVTVSSLAELDPSTGCLWCMGECLSLGFNGWFGVAGSSASVSTFPPWLRQGPEITDELVRVLRRRLDEATLDVITVMLVRNCKLTPADVEVSSRPDSRVLHGAVADAGQSGPERLPATLTPLPALRSSSSHREVSLQRCCIWPCPPPAGPGFLPWPGTYGKTCSFSCTLPSTQTAMARTTSR